MKQKGHGDVQSTEKQWFADRHFPQQSVGVMCTISPDWCGKAQ